MYFPFDWYTETNKPHQASTTARLDLTHIPIIMPSVLALGHSRRPDALATPKDKRKKPAFVRSSIQWNIRLGQTLVQQTMFSKATLTIAPPAWAPELEIAH
jgi:hypothetical protein